MKLPGGKEFRAVALPAEPGRLPRVELQLLMFGAKLGADAADTGTVRQLATELLQACDQAEGRAA